MNTIEVDKSNFMVYSDMGVALQEERLKAQIYEMSMLESLTTDVSDDIIDKMLPMLSEAREHGTITYDDRESSRLCAEYIDEFGTGWRCWGMVRCPRASSVTCAISCALCIS